MSTEDSSQRIAEEIDRLEHHYLVGRDREIEFFLELLSKKNPERSIINVYGTGGVGKSYLLDEFRRLSEKAHIPFISINSRSFQKSPFEFCSYLLRLVRYPISQAEKWPTDIPLLTEICADEIQKAAVQGKLILAFDNFEEFGEMEYWLRDEFLTQLSPKILMIISGRQPLHEGWLSSPAWRQMIVRLPLEDLEYGAVKQYLALAGIIEEMMISHIWIHTKGHPLTLSLFVYTTLAQRKTKFPNNQEIFPYVVKTWLKEVTDPDIRELVEAASVLRHFNLETLSFILEKKVTSGHFQKLIGHSFVRKVDRGWLLHDLLRDAIAFELRQSMPEYYDRLWKRCVLHYYLHLKKSINNKSISWESSEWVYFIGDRLIRTLFYQDSVSYQLESLHLSNWIEAERYIENRRRFVQDVRIVHTDSDTEEQYEYLITEKESLFGFKHVQLQELFDLDRNIVKLIRDTGGKVCGMSAIVPIHEGTLDFLISKPPFSGYFASLSRSKLQELRTPKDCIAGYFVEFIDVDYADPTMRQVAGLTFITFMLSAGLVVTTAPANLFFHSIFQSLGFEKTKNVVHFHYDDHIPTPYFVLDTRGKRLLNYLNKMITSLGLEQEEKDGDERFHLLSNRERDVMKLLVKGRTNSEIAVELSLSEATVKKHVFHIFGKLQVKNRIQLMNKFRDD